MIIIVLFRHRILFSAGFVIQSLRGHVIVHNNKRNTAFPLFSSAFSKARTYYKAALRTFPPSISKPITPSNTTFALEVRTTVRRSSSQQHQRQQATAMLSSIFISALLAGPVVAGVIPRQNTVTVTSIIATSTVFASYTPSSSAPAPTFNLPKAFAAELGLNPINGLPAAPPQNLKPTTTAAQALSSSPVPKRLGSASSTTTPLVFRTYTSSNGAPAPTATNSPKLTKSAAASSPTLTRLIKSTSAPSSSAALPSSYSSLQRAPPSFPGLTSDEPAQKTSTASSTLTTSTTTTTTSPPPPPPAPTETETEDAIPSELAALFTSSKESNPYPYPTPQPKKPKPSNFQYPYPPRQ